MERKDDRPHEVVTLAGDVPALGLKAGDMIEVSVEQDTTVTRRLSPAEAVRLLLCYSDQLRPVEGQPGAFAAALEVAP